MYGLKDKLESELAQLNPVAYFEQELEQSMPWITAATTKLVEQSLIDSNRGRDENYITDQVFYFRHPEWRGKKLPGTDAQYSGLRKEWISIRDTLVRPALGQRKHYTLTDALKAVGEDIGTPVQKQGKISKPEWNLRSRPEPSNDLIVGKLKSNATIFVDREYKRPGETLSWYYVFGPSGEFGWVRSDGVAMDPPEPSADIYTVVKDDKLIDIAGQFYKSADGFSWGEDARYYVLAIAYANQMVGRTQPFINMPKTHAEWKERSKWSEVGVKKDSSIWIPSKEFMQTLRPFINSGSITYEIWDRAKRFVNKILDWIKYAAGFIAGFVKGALESIYDLLTAIPDMVKAVWKIIKSLVAGDPLKDAKKIYDALTSLDVKQMGQDFWNKWTSDNAWDRGLFRGRIAGYVVVEILLAAFSVGTLTVVKWGGKFAKLMMMVTKLEGVLKFTTRMADKLRHIPFPEKAKDLLKKIFKGDDVDHNAPKSPKVPGKSSLFIMLGKMDLDIMRKKFKIPNDLHTIAVGKTDVPGMGDLLFEGGSRDVRAMMYNKNPKVEIPRPTQHLEVDPRHAHSRMQWMQDHAEQDILNHFIDGVKKKKIRPGDLEGKTLAIHISNPRGVCTICAADVGIFKQFERDYPGMVVRVSWNDVNGKLQYRLWPDKK